MASLSGLAGAKRELKPLVQGDLDSLCGLYAVINAVRLTVYPDHILTPSTVRHLFEHGLGVLSNKRRLKQTVAHGVENAVWLLMCRAVIAEAATLIGCRISIAQLVGADRPWMTRDVVRNIKKAVNEERPVLICLEGRLNHWSVIAGITATRLILFDSASCCWISINSLTTNFRKQRKPHLVGREGAFVVDCSLLRTSAEN